MPFNPKAARPFLPLASGQRPDGVVELAARRQSAFDTRTGRRGLAATQPCTALNQRRIGFQLRLAAARRHLRPPPGGRDIAVLR